jgi:hypothetical protein
VYNQPCLLLGCLPVGDSALLFTGEWEERERDCLGLERKLVVKSLDPEVVDILGKNFVVDNFGCFLTEFGNLLRGKSVPIKACSWFLFVESELKVKEDPENIEKFGDSLFSYFCGISMDLVIPLLTELHWYSGLFGIGFVMAREWEDLDRKGWST